MCFVCHDISSPKKCSHILRSFWRNFPKMQYFILVDIVSFSETVPTIMPGFEYVHGLQGFTTRNYEETLQTLEEAQFDIIKEIKVPNMPNTFIWVTKPSL